MRRAALELVSRAPWPGDDATPQDVAELVLLRLLWLQREAHRSARLRQFEATMLLARAAVEACIAGHYWLLTENAVVRLSSGNAWALRRMLAYIADGDALDVELLDDVTAILGDRKALPDLRTMADVVVTRTDERFADDLYRRLYIPLSTFFPHPTGVALLRHVRANRDLSDVPVPVWSTRAALHATDATVAHLATTIANRAGAPTTELVSYADAHMSRTVTPVFALAGRTALRTVRWSKLPLMLRELKELRQYHHLGEAARDTHEERKTRTARVLDQALQLLGGDVPSDFRELLIDRAAEAIAQSPTNT